MKRIGMFCKRKHSKIQDFEIGQVLNMKRFSLKLGVSIASLTFLLSSYGSAQQGTPLAPLKNFVDHGIPATVSESRGIMAIRDKNGAPLILAFARDHFKDNPRSSLLVIDAKTGKTEQYWYPQREQANGDVL